MLTNAVPSSARRRVVVTGLGVVAPGATDLTSFEALLRRGLSPVRYDAELERLGFGSCISARATWSEEQWRRHTSELEQRRLSSAGLRYGLLAGLEAWANCGLQFAEEHAQSRWGVVFGTSIPGIDVLGRAIRAVDAGRVRRLGSAVLETQMPSSLATSLAARLGAGGQVSCPCSACATGTEALILGMQRIHSGAADVVLVGSAESEGPHLWAGFDTLRLLARGFEQTPELASRPLSSSACGIVAGSGAAALVLESLEHARERRAPVYCEVLGGAINCGGQRQGGSATAPNPQAIVACIRQALADSRVPTEEVDAISGHLTGTKVDPIEVQCWADALQRDGDQFPHLNAPKSLFGHSFSASGAIELVACALQLQRHFLHPSRNCEDVHPFIQNRIDTRRIVRGGELRVRSNVMLKASFGFGDVNACVVLAHEG